MEDNRRQPLIIAILAVAVVAVFAVILFLIFRPRSEPEPTLVPTVPVADESWSRIEQAGRMIVGTAADYPPFEYYTKDFQLEGFDIALIRELGRRLGVEVLIQDMAFDGLGGALQLGQIDLVISAVSITPERGQFVDFSNIYFVTEDAILTTAEKQVAVNGPQDLAGRRIGVQSGSVHEEWAQSELVDTGLTDQSSLILYREIDRSVDDLAQGLIDFVIVDLPPAQRAVDVGGFVIAGQGLNRQRFAMAIPKGATALKAKLNQALSEMQIEGRIDDLAKTYLGLDKEDLIPVPTPDPNEPTPTPVPPGPPPACIDAMQWVADLSYDDQDMTNIPQLPPGQPFVKSWRVRNTGTCTWDTSYALVYAGGNTSAARMGGGPAAIDRLVSPGETYDFNVDLVAPLIPGTYQAFWTMRNGVGQLFGDRLWVGITVPSSATPTPLPTQTPVPGVSFTVDRTNITAGECVVFTWDVQNVQAVYFYADGQPWQDNGVLGQGTRTECPPTTITYNLRVVFRDGTVEVRKIRIEVQPSSVDAPYVARFSVNPEGQILVGQCVGIGWDVQGQVNSVKLTRDGTDLWNPAPNRGDIQDCPPGPGTVAYGIEATGPGGTSRSQRHVNVVQSTAPPPTATPVPATPVPDPPVINAFSVTPNQIQTGQCFQISWRTGGGTTLVQILRNGVIVVDNGPFEGSGQDCRNEAGSVTYSLVASNRVGASVREDRAVNVTESSSQNPLAGTSWRLAFIDDGAGTMAPVLEGSSVTARFTADGSVNGVAGCNSYSAGYTVNGDALTIGPPTATSQLCGQPAGVMEQESAFLTAMQSAATFQIVDRELEIFSASGGQLLIFTVAPAPR